LIPAMIIALAEILCTESRSFQVRGFPSWSLGTRRNGFFWTDVRYSMMPLSGILSATSVKPEDAIAFSIAVSFYVFICLVPPLAFYRTYRARHEEASDLSE